MAKVYKKTEALKFNILDTAGRYFKEYGYNGTTFQMISDDLKISKASISYHFKSKPFLLLCLFGKSMEVIYRYVRENFNCGSNSYNIHCTSHIYFYRKVMSQERYRRLFFHLDYRQLWVNEFLYVIEGYFKNIMTDFKKDFTDDEIRELVLMSLGAKLSLYNAFVNNPGSISIDNFCLRTASLVGNFSKLDEATVARNVQRAFEFVSSHTLSSIDFLD